MKKQSFILALSLVISLGACAGPQQELPPQVTTPQTPAESTPIHTQEVNFNVSLPGGFKTQQVAQVAFAKLEVSNGTQTVSALGADEDGFIEAQGNTIQLSANVPDGNNWVATIGFYPNKDSTPFLELKTLFHIPLTGNSVNINLQTHLTGALAESLRTLAPERLNQALDVNAMQRFVNELTGAQISNNTLSFTRLGDLTPPTPVSLDPRLVAMEILEQNIQFTAQESYASFSPNSFLPVPNRLGVYSNIIGGKTLGIDQQIAINPFNGHLFFNTTDDPPSTGSQGDVNENLYGLVWNASTKSFSPSFAAQTFENIQSGSLSLGSCNPAGNSSQAAAFLTERTNAGTGILKAVSQSTGQVFWQYDMGNVAEYAFTPVLKRIANCACSCDDEHLAIIARRSDVNTYRILALREERASYPTAGSCATTPLPAGTGNGHVVWSYPPEGQAELSTPFQPGGSLSHDKQMLYVLTRNDASSKLLHISTETGAVMFESDLGSNPVGAPAIGKNGTIYVSSERHVRAFSPTDGSQLWSKSGSASSFISRFNTSPVVDYVNGRDIVYAIDTQPSAQVSKPALNVFYGDTGEKKWSTALSLDAQGQIPITGLLLGEESTGKRVIYVGISDNRVYAIHDEGDMGQLAWRQFPDGTLWGSNNAFTKGIFNWGSITHRDNTLFVATRDGGDGQILAVRALKVSTQGMPSSAPWPKMSGNLANSGISHLETP